MKVLSIQDISCYGQCSLTVALPILSSYGIETVILPSAVLSTHTSGFKNFTVLDLTDEMPKIINHWINEGIMFDAIYTGYIGDVRQFDYILECKEKLLKKDGLFIVDPAMADHGKLYPALNEDIVEGMKRICSVADYIIPNITEACFLTGTEYKTEYDRAYIDMLLEKLAALGCGNIIFTGISYAEGKTGVVVYENGVYSYYEHDKLGKGCHGTGDVYASAFVGAFMRGKTAYEAAKIAADYAVACIKKTAELDNHWYGAAFEPVLGKLIQMIEE